MNPNKYWNVQICIIVPLIKTVYHFVDSNLGVEMPQKRGVNRKRGGNFGSRSAWESGRKSLPGGPGTGGKYTD